MGWMKGTQNVGKKIQKGNLGGAASDYVTGKVWREDWKSNVEKATHQSGGGTDEIPEQKIDAPMIEKPVMDPNAVAPTFTGGKLSTENIVLQGPKAAVVDTAPQDQFRAQQTALAEQLAQRASGQGPFISDLALKQAQDTNQAAAFAQLASARGGANPLLARQTMSTAADLAAKAGRDAAIAKMQEAQAAQSLLGTVAGQARGQDINLATEQAGFNQQAGIVGYQGGIEQMKAQGAWDQATGQGNADLAAQFQNLQAEYIRMGLDADKANQLASIEVQKYYQPGQTIQRPVGPSMMSGVLTGVGAGVGAYFGGPAGAAAGAKIGGAVGSAGDKQYGSKRGQAAAYQNQQSGSGPKYGGGSGAGSSPSGDYNDLGATIGSAVGGKLADSRDKREAGDAERYDDAKSGGSGQTKREKIDAWLEMEKKRKEARDNEKKDDFVGPKK